MPGFFLLIGSLLLAIPEMTIAQTKTTIGDSSSSTQTFPKGKLQLSTSITNEPVLLRWILFLAATNLTIEFHKRGEAPVSSWTRAAQ
jgi:hypothetical protein